MRLENYSSEKLKSEIITIISEYLDVKAYRVFFFGSRVTNKGNERSDIDVGIHGPEPIPAKIMLTIEEEIDKLPILYKIEIVDFCRVSAQFRDVAKKQVEFILS